MIGNRLPGGAPEQDTTQIIMNSACVLAAKILAIQSGIMTMSLPPQVHYSVQVEDARPLRGALPEEIRLIVWGQEPPCKAGDNVLLYGGETDGEVVYTGVLVSTAPNYNAVVEALAAVPLGWTSGPSGAVSPFTKKFPDLQCPCLEGAVRCAATGRPSLVPAHVSVRAEQVIPADAHEYRNPYGDGMFTITFKNAGSEEAAIPVFADAATHEPLLEQSVICVVNGKPHVFPEALPAKVEVVKLAPGQELKGTINTLKLPTVEWPNGGMRVYFTFAFGGLTCSNFFYYYSSTHDPMREALGN